MAAIRRTVSAAAVVSSAGRPLSMSNSTAIPCTAAKPRDGLSAMTLATFAPAPRPYQPAGMVSNTDSESPSLRVP